MDYLKQLFKNILDFVRLMTPSQAIMFIGIIAGFIIGGVVVSGWINDVNYSTLYSNIDSSEAGEVVNYLNEQKIPYQLSEAGSSRPCLSLFLVIWITYFNLNFLFSGLIKIS